MIGSNRIKFLLQNSNGAGDPFVLLPLSDVMAKICYIASRVTIIQKL